MVEKPPSDPIYKRLLWQMELDITMKQVADLRDAGKLKEARKLMKKAEALYAKLRP